jgi:hypothetical protein
VELLQSQQYLQAALQFTTHIQALTTEEHQLLGKFAAHQVQQCNAAIGVGKEYTKALLASCTAAGSGPPCITPTACKHDTGAEGARAGAQASEDQTATAALLLSAQAKMLEAALRVVLRRQKQDMRPAVSQVRGLIGS